MGNGKLLQFDTLKTKFNLPNTRLFRYLQLTHAYNAQFGGTILRMQMSDLESLLGEYALDKVLSTIYKQLFTAVGELLSRCRAAWEALFPQMEGGDWNDIWNINFT